MVLCSTCHKPATRGACIDGMFTGVCDADECVKEHHERYKDDPRDSVVLRPIKKEDDTW